jgi:hypothetical protein
MSIVRGSQSSSRRHRSANSGEQRYGEQVCARIASCDPTWTCRPSTSRPARRGADGLGRVVLVEPELGAAVAGADRLVRLGLDPGVTRTSTRRTPAAARARARRARRGRRARRRGRRAQLLVRLVVPVHEQALAVDPGPLRERELAERRDVRAEPSSASRRISATFGNAFVP